MKYRLRQEYFRHELIDILKQDNSKVLTRSIKDKSY